MFFELRGEKWDHPASSRSINGSMPSIIEVFKTSSDERTSLSRIFHGRKGRSLVLKTGATLFPCKGRRGSNEGTERLGILHEEENVDPRITIMSLFVSTTGWSFTLLEEKPRLRRKVVFFLPFLFFFPFLFFSFLPSFLLSLSTFARERVFASHLARNDHSITFLPLFPLYLRIFFFFSFNKCWGKIFLEGKLLLEIIRLILRSNLIFDHDASYIYFFRFLFRFDSV